MTTTMTATEFATTFGFSPKTGFRYVLVAASRALDGAVTTVQSCRTLPAAEKAFSRFSGKNWKVFSNLRIIEIV